MGLRRLLDEIDSPLCLLFACPGLVGQHCRARVAQSLPDAEPAMWVVKDADTTIYLFGTFTRSTARPTGSMTKCVRPSTPRRKWCLRSITPENPAEMRPALLRHALTPPTAPTLSSKLSPEGRARLAAILAKNKMPPGALDRFRPFFASVTWPRLQFGAMGMGVEQGAEAVIRRAMKGGNKQLGAVETVDEQFALLNALPEAEQLRIMESSLKEDGSMATEITSMLAAWNRATPRPWPRRSSKATRKARRCTN
jgi:uncharacterized protein YbaP (TraB family)